MEIIIAIAGLIVAGISTYYGRKQYQIAKSSKEKETKNHSPQEGQLITEIPNLYSGKSILEDFSDLNYRNWVTDELGFIDIRGIHIGTAQSRVAMRFPILELYTELYVQKGLTNWDLDQGNLMSGQRISLLKMLESTRCISLVGDPGSGKTTFLRYVGRKQIFDNSNLLPIYIDLPDFFQFVTNLNKRKNRVINFEDLPIIEPDQIINYLLEIGKKENLDLNYQGLTKRFIEGKFIFLFDSLDELSSVNSRELLVDGITRFAKIWDKCKFIIASRPLALIGKSVPVGFEIVGIAPFGNEEIKTFLHKWSIQLFQSDSLQNKFYNALYSEIHDNQQLLSLAHNPVMLTCMAVLHHNNRHLPAGRADLLEAVIQWLISAKDPSSRKNNETNEFILSCYSHLALNMFESSPGPKNRVGRNWAANSISKFFQNDSNKALDFLTREENQTGLLVRRGEGDLSFWHYSFLEYLGAREISGKTDDEHTGWWNKIKNRLYDTQWKEVISLVPCCLNRLGSERVDLFFERISQISLEKDISYKVKTVGFAGVVLQDLISLGYHPIQVVSWNKLLKEIEPIFHNNLEGVSLEDRFKAAVAYGLSDDQSLIDFSNVWVPIPEGVFFMGAQKKDPQQINFDEFANPWEGPIIEIKLAEFEMNKYPTTTKEFEKFILDEGYTNIAFWSNEGWKWREENKVFSPANWENQLLYPNCPVTSVSWYEANAFCKWLSQVNDKYNYLYRLPSEAEWEYVATRNASGKRFPWGNKIKEADSAESNWGGCNLRKKSPVGMFPLSNTTDGVTDMFGNVEEWCYDCWSFNHSNYSQNGNPRIIDGELRKVVRGGSTIRYMRLCRPTYRSKTYANQRYQTIGIRAIRTKIK